MGRDFRLDSGQFTFAKSESPQWPEEVKILKKKNGLTQPPRNTTFASHPYSGLCLAFDFPQISFPTSSSAARKYDFVFGNTTEIIQRCSSLLIRNSLGKLINWQQKLVICEMVFSDLLLCNNDVKQLFEPLYWNLKLININIHMPIFNTTNVSQEKQSWRVYVMHCRCLCILPK